VDKHLVPAFGDQPLHLLKREDVKRLIARLDKEKKSKGTIKNILVPLKAAYNVAIEDGLVTFNPASRLGRLLKASGDRRQHLQPLNSEEVIQLLKKAKEAYPSLYPVLLCAARTGLRMGELIGLQWGDIDFHGGFIEVRRAVVMGRETTTKSHKIRRVDMSRQLMEELKRRKEIRQLEAMNGEELLPWVFLSPGGIRLDERNLRRSWYRCLEQAEIRTVRFHDLRHTFVSLLIQKGVHPKYIQEQAGHSSIQVTMDTYGHLFPNLNREWVNKLDDNEGFVPVSYPAQVQGLNGNEQRADKPLESQGKCMVAVPRIERGTRGL
jgi:integrase